MELYSIADDLEETGQEIDFPAWWQAMITDAASKMVKAKHYLDFELKEPAIDAAVDALTGKKLHMNKLKPSMMDDLDEGFLDRVKANVKGTVATVGQAAKNVGAAVSGNLDQVKSVTMSKGLAKLGQKTKTLGKELDDVINDIDKLFSPKDLQNPQLRDLLDKYVSNLKQTKQFSQSLASGNYKVTPTPDSEVKPVSKPTTPAPSSPAQTTQAAPASSAKTTPARDEKGRFVSNKPTTDTKTATSPTNVKPISTNYTVTKDTYSYKGKSYPIQVDKNTKEKFFKGDDGRIMDISALEKFSQTKKKAVAEKLAKQLKSK
jgi:hypothetical protein